MQQLRTKAAARWEATGHAHLASAVVHAVGARLLGRGESDASAAAEVVVAVVRATAGAILHGRCIMGVLAD